MSSSSNYLRDKFKEFLKKKSSNVEDAFYAGAFAVILELTNGPSESVDAFRGPATLSQMLVEYSMYIHKIRGGNDAVQSLDDGD